MAPSIAAIPPPAESPAANTRLTIDIMFSDEVCGKSGDNGRFAGPAHLIAGIKPVPTRGWVGRFRLTGICHDKSMLLGQLVHPRPGCEVIRVLSAAMQHDQQ